MFTSKRSRRLALEERGIAVVDRQIAEIPGWFWAPDTDLFRLLLAESRLRLGAGDLAEIGVYMGRSAVLLGSYKAKGETFTVIDLFGVSAPDQGNQRENNEEYSSLTRAKFETNYRSIHNDLPVVVRDASSAILAHATANNHRFVHVDGSHLYEHVVKDIQSAKTLLMTDGVVVLDDYRSAHTPGVAAAAWQAVSEGMRPFCLTPLKMYATWGDPSPWRDIIEKWLPSSSAMHGRHVIGDDEVLRLWLPISRRAMGAVQRGKAKFRAAVRRR